MNGEFGFCDGGEGRMGDGGTGMRVLVGLVGVGNGRGLAASGDGAPTRD